MQWIDHISDIYNSFLLYFQKHLNKVKSKSKRVVVPFKCLWLAWFGRKKKNLRFSDKIINLYYKIGTLKIVNLYYKIESYFLGRSPCLFSNPSSSSHWLDSVDCWGTISMLQVSDWKNHYLVNPTFGSGKKSC